jgi:hypothetical protein
MTLLDSRSRLGLVLASLVAVLSSCTGLEPTRSGFLTDDSTLSPECGDENWLSSTDEFERWRGVTGFVLEPVLLLPEAEPHAGEDAELLVAHFEDRLRRALAEALPEVPSQAPNTVRVRAAITAVDRAEPVLNGFTFLLTGFPFDNGGACVELEIVDHELNVLHRSSITRTGSVWRFWRGFGRSAFARDGLAKAANDVAQHVAARIELAQRIEGRP